MQDFLINNPVFSNDQNGIPWGMPFFEQFPAIRYNLFNEKRKGFSLLSGLCDDRITCFDKGIAVFTFSLYYFELFTVKINILQAYTSHFIQHEPQPYNRPMSILCLSSWQWWSNRKLLLYLVLWGVFCRVLSMVNVGTHKATLQFK
jgi:hypothetical protein